jgi:hypothetical protein
LSLASIVAAGYDVPELIAIIVRIMRPFRLCILAAVFGFSAGVFAQAAGPQGEFRVGLKTITIPTPGAELIETGSDYRVLLEIFVPTSNRLVAGFLSPEELANIRSSTSLDRYALVEVGRPLEFTDVSQDVFNQVAVAAASQFGATFNGKLNDYQEDINRTLKSVGRDASVTLDKPRMLGTFFSKPDACAFGSIMAGNVNGGATKQFVMGVSFIRVKDRLLYLYLYNAYRDENSV